jgi:hypothetical protein
MGWAKLLVCARRANDFRVALFNDYSVRNVHLAKSEKRLGDATSALALRRFSSMFGCIKISVRGVDGVGGFEEGLDVGGDGLQTREGFLDFGA